jgi:hypothetical protein
MEAKMRLPTKTLLALAVALPATYGTAYAQTVGVEVYGGPAYSYSDYNYGPSDDVVVTRRSRTYSYRTEVDTPDVEVRIRPANCGQYRYWNGVRCADARINPPDLD